MNKFIKTLNFFPVVLLAVAMFAVSSNPQIALAQMGVEVLDSYEGSQQKDLPGAIMSVINYVLIFVGVLALAYLVYGGFLYITAGGDSGQVDKAKSSIINAIIGIVVIGLAAAVVNFVIMAVAGG